MGCWKYNLSDKKFEAYQQKLFAHHGKVIAQFIQSIHPTVRVIPYLSFENIRPLRPDAPPTCGIIVIEYQDYGHCVAFFWDQTHLFLFDPALSKTRPTRKSKQHLLVMDSITQKFGPLLHCQWVYSEEMMEDGAPWQLDSQSLYDGFCHTYSLLWLQSVLKKTSCSSVRDQLHGQMMDLAYGLQSKEKNTVYCANK